MDNKISPVERSTKWRIDNKEKYREYQREYHRKIYEQMKKFKQLQKIIN